MLAFIICNIRNVILCTCRTSAKVLGTSQVIVDAQFWPRIPSTNPQVFLDGRFDENLSWDVDGVRLENNVKVLASAFHLNLKWSHVLNPSLICTWKTWNILGWAFPTPHGSRIQRICQIPYMSEDTTRTHVWRLSPEWTWYLWAEVSTLPRFHSLPQSLQQGKELRQEVWVFLAGWDEEHCGNP